jgi:hypothetical protein
MNEVEIIWAPRVPQSLIHRLYEMDALGIQDEELIDEVGWRLLARCQSFVSAVEAARGKVLCPACNQEINHEGKPDELLHCQRCGWETTWKAFFKTFQHKQLSGADPVLQLFRIYIRGYPCAASYQQKMLLVDRLIHGFHIYLGEPTRTTAVNLIEGRYHEVVNFLDRLSYGQDSTVGIQSVYKDWRQKIDETGKK